MSTIWDWSPVVRVAGNYLDNQSGPSLLDRFMGNPQSIPQDIALPAQQEAGPTNPISGGPRNAAIGGDPVQQLRTMSLAMPSVNGTYAPGVPVAYGGPLGQALGSAASFLQGVGNALPLLLQHGPQGDGEPLSDALVRPMRQTNGPVQPQMQFFQRPKPGAPLPAIRLMTAPYR